MRQKKEEDKNVLDVSMKRDVFKEGKGTQSDEVIKSFKKRQNT